MVRASTDGRYGSWNDGKLLNYRIFEVWQWIAEAVGTLVDQFDIDGIRFDTAHAVPIMMKKNNFPFIYDRKRTPQEMVQGTIVSNDREDEHLITTGYYDSACRDTIAVPFQTFLVRSIERHSRVLLGKRALSGTIGGTALQHIAVQNLRKHHTRRSRCQGDLSPLRRLLFDGAASRNGNGRHSRQSRRASCP